MEDSKPPASVPPKAKSQFDEVLKNVPLERQADWVRALLNQPTPPPAKK